MRHFAHRAVEVRCSARGTASPCAAVGSASAIFSRFSTWVPDERPPWSGIHPLKFCSWHGGVSRPRLGPAARQPCVQISDQPDDATPKPDRLRERRIFEAHLEKVGPAYTAICCGSASIEGARRRLGVLGPLLGKHGSELVAHQRGQFITGVVGELRELDLREENVGGHDCWAPSTNWSHHSQSADPRNNCRSG